MANKKKWQESIKDTYSLHWQTPELKEELFYNILAAIEDNPEWITIDDVATGMHFCRSNIYKWWSPNSKERSAIHSALQGNKTKIKQNLRRKMQQSDNPTDRKMLYQLCATAEESAALGLYIKSDERIQGEITINLNLD